MCSLNATVLFEFEARERRGFCHVYFICISIISTAKVTRKLLNTDEDGLATVDCSVKLRSFTARGFSLEDVEIKQLTIEFGKYAWR